MIIIGGLNDYQHALNDIVVLEYAKKRWNFLYHGEELKKRAPAPEKMVGI